MFFVFVIVPTLYWRVRWPEHTSCCFPQTDGWKQWTLSLTVVTFLYTHFHFLLHSLSLPKHFLLLSPVCDNEHWVLMLSVSFIHAFTFYCIQLHFLPNSLSITFTCMWPGHHQVLLTLSDENNNCCTVVTCIFFYTYFLLHYCLLPLSICSVFPHTMLNAGVCDLATKCWFCQTREKTNHWVVLLCCCHFHFF